MIIDKIENASRYYKLDHGIAEALKYIQNNDLRKTAPGKYEIVNKKVSMLVQEYEQANTDQIKLEAHQKNIDVQYWVSGSELMGYAPFQPEIVITPFDKEKDFGFYQADGTFTRFKSGMFVIYFPGEMHTAIKDEQCQMNVRKIVFKVISE